VGDRHRHDRHRGRPRRRRSRPGPTRSSRQRTPNARFGQFEASDLKQFLAVQEDRSAPRSRGVSGTPLHYLFITRGDFPSGEAMKSAEARFTRKIQDRQVAFGNEWEDAIAFALRVEGEERSSRRTWMTLWETASPRSERELLETLVLKQALGVPRAQLIRELGYEADKADELIAAAEEQATADRERQAQVVLPTTATGRQRFPGNERRDRRAEGGIRSHVSCGAGRRQAPGRPSRVANQPDSGPRPARRSTVARPIGARHEHNRNRDGRPGGSRTRKRGPGGRRARPGRRRRIESTVRGDRPQAAVGKPRDAGPAEGSRGEGRRVREAGAVRQGTPRARAR
jgi:hypothetical protein